MGLGKNRAFIAQTYSAKKRPKNHEKNTYNSNNEHARATEMLFAIGCELTPRQECNARTAARKPWSNRWWFERGKLRATSSHQKKTRSCQARQTRHNTQNLWLGEPTAAQSLDGQTSSIMIQHSHSKADLTQQHTSYDWESRLQHHHLTAELQASWFNIAMPWRDWTAWFFKQISWANSSGATWRGEDKQIFQMMCGRGWFDATWEPDLAGKLDRKGPPHARRSQVCSPNHSLCVVASSLLWYGYVETWCLRFGCQVTVLLSDHQIFVGLLAVKFALAWLCWIMMLEV